MTDKEVDGEYRWRLSGEELQDNSWWRSGEPDSKGDCVSLSGYGGLQNDICNDANINDGLIIRKPLCMIGSE